jgi:hypothetical protein
MSKNRPIIRELRILQVKATLTGYKSYRGILGLKLIQVRVADSDLCHKIQVQEPDIDRAGHREESGLCDINKIEGCLSIDNKDAMRYTGAAIVCKEDMIEICLRLEQGY